MGSPAISLIVAVARAREAERAVNEPSRRVRLVLRRKT